MAVARYRRTPSRWLLSGQAYFVQDARKCDQFLVSAQNDGDIALVLVQADAKGLTITPDAIIDLTRDQARLSFDGVEGTVVAEAGQGSAALDQALAARLCLVSADMVGSGEWLLQTTTEYAKTRVQFDRPLGFFQAVKHPSQCDDSNRQRQVADVQRGLCG